MTVSPRAAAARTKRWIAREAGADLRARWYLRKARDVGARPRIVGRPLVTNPDLHIGDDLLLWSHHRMTHLGGVGRIELGDRVFLNAGVVLLSFREIVVEDDVALASEVFVTDSDNHAIGDQAIREEPIRIGRGSWIATRSIILPGVHIGTRAVVAAGSVVSDDVDDDTLVAGVPARVIRRIDYPSGRRTAWKE